MAARLTDYDRMFPLGDPPDYEPAQESSLGARARREGRDPREVIYDYLIEGEGKNFIFSPFANFAAYNLDCCSEMMQSPHTLIGLGDGGAHVGLISDGSFPTSLLSHWGRDRASGRLDVSWLVKRQTSDNARAVGLNDRGRVAPGYKADLNVIDFDKLRVEAPVMKWDLPAGGKRLLQKARGYRATIVSGAVTYRDGEATGALPGKLVRGPQASPRDQNDARHHEADAEQVNRRQAFVESERRCECDDGKTGAGENRIGDGERDRLDRTRKQEGVGGAEHQSDREHRPPDARHGVGDRPVDEVRRDVEEHRAAELQVGAPHSATGSVSRPRRVKVGRRVGGAASSIVGKASSSALKAMAAFHARQRRAQAVMDAAAEGHVLAGVAGDVEAVRLGEGRGIAVGRAQDQQDFVAFPDLVAEQVEILHGDALVDLHRPVEAQELVDRRADQLGLAPQQGELVGRAQQRQHAVADQVHGRFVARHQQQLGERDDLAGRDAVAVDIDGGERRQKIVARLATALGQKARRDRSAGRRGRRRSRPRPPGCAGSRDRPNGRCRATSW